MNNLYKKSKIIASYNIDTKLSIGDQIKIPIVDILSDFRYIHIVSTDSNNNDITYSIIIDLSITNSFRIMNDSIMDIVYRPSMAFDFWGKIRNEYLELNVHKVHNSTGWFDTNNRILMIGVY